MFIYSSRLTVAELRDMFRDSVSLLLPHWHDYGKLFSPLSKNLVERLLMGHEKPLDFGGNPDDVTLGLGLRLGLG